VPSADRRIAEWRFQIDGLVIADCWRLPIADDCRVLTIAECWQLAIAECWRLTIAECWRLAIAECCRLAIAECCRLTIADGRRLLAGATRTGLFVQAVLLRFARFGGFSGAHEDRHEFVRFLNQRRRRRRVCLPRFDEQLQPPF